MQPSISVVIPVHNRPRDVNAALDSVMAQTFLPIEAIVVDDGSTDDTVASVYNRMGDPIPVRVKLVSPNRGGGHARNVGIDAARGDWVALLDSDDCWIPDKLERQIVRLAGAEAASANIVCFSNLAVDHHNGQAPQPWNRMPFADGGNAQAFILADHQAIQTSTLVMPTRLARNVRFDERLRRHQDLDFVLRLYHGGTRFMYIDASLVTYSADPAAARVSKRVNATPSLTWLDIAHGYTDHRLLSCFYMREVFGMEYEDNPLRALKKLALYIARGDIQLLSGLRVALRSIVPSRTKELVKAMIGR